MQFTSSHTTTSGNSALCICVNYYKGRMRALESNTAVAFTFNCKVSALTRPQRKQPEESPLNHPRCLPAPRQAQRASSVNYWRQLLFDVNHPDSLTYSTAGAGLTGAHGDVMSNGGNATAFKMLRKQPQVSRGSREAAGALRSRRFRASSTLTRLRHTVQQHGGFSPVLAHLII